MKKSRSLGDLQLAILRELWRRREATVAEVHKGLHKKRQLALTTIATMLRKMEDRRLVKHRTEGRQFIYRAAVQEEEVHRNLVADVVDRVFAGDASAMVSHLLEEEALDPDELAEIKALIRAKERALKARKPRRGGGR
ncbi:MAG: BlaI/MecI/CopY family transcriptional regulator [Planctomycetota bacterium]